MNHLFESTLSPGNIQQCTIVLVHKRNKRNIRIINTVCSTKSSRRYFKIVTEERLRSELLYPRRGKYGSRLFSERAQSGIILPLAAGASTVDVHQHFDKIHPRFLM